MGARQARAFDHAEWFATSRGGFLLMFVWAAGEATVWPIIADFLLLPLAAASGRRFNGPLAAAVSGMAFGGIAAYLFALRSLERSERILQRLPLTPANKITVAERHLQCMGIAAFLFQPYSGIPMKVWSVAAARLPLDPWRAIPVFVAARAVRMTLVAAAGGLAGDRFHRALREHFIVLSSAYAAIFFAIWGRMISTSAGEDAE